MAKPTHTKEYLRRKAFEYVAEHGEYPTVNEMAKRYKADRNRLTQVLKEQRTVAPPSAIHYAALYLLGTTPREIVQKLQDLENIDLGKRKNELRAMAALKGMKPKEIEALSRDELRGRLKRVKFDDFLKRVDLHPLETPGGAN